MPETINDKLAAPVGNGTDKPANEIVEVIDAAVGTYEPEQPAITNAPKPSQGGIQQHPFKLR